MGFCLSCRAGRHLRATHAVRGANWCMGFWCRLKLRAPSGVRGLRAWAFCPACALCSGHLAAGCGTRGSKQERLYADAGRWTLMHADRTWTTAPPRLVKSGRTMFAVNGHAGLSFIRVHQRASGVHLRGVLLALTRAARARQGAPRSGMTQGPGAASLTLPAVRHGACGSALGSGRPPVSVGTWTAPRPRELVHGLLAASPDEPAAVP